VFSFGIVLWEILTGEEPYANMHYGGIIGNIAFSCLSFVFSVEELYELSSLLYHLQMGLPLYIEATAH